MTKSISEMSQGELGAFVQSHLKTKGIDVVLSGGAVVSIYSQNRYVSLDLDMINTRTVRHQKIASVMMRIGFQEEGRHFTHPGTKFFVEFPPGPLTIGEEPVGQINEIHYSTGVLRILSPTDCIKDRLAAFYFWGDRQCLHQAIWVAQKQNFDFDEVRRWSQDEGRLDEFEEFRTKLTTDE
ncbi:MAG: hypothetical protein HN413_12715 [Chloroflexi bacterium]|jgi:hypothetical protein|nr:hypothetical protein [Chloroflexota bacterium]